MPRQSRHERGLRVELLTNGMYAFGDKYVGQVLPAVRFGNGYKVTLPVCENSRKLNGTVWIYMGHEAKVVE